MELSPTSNIPKNSTRKVSITFHPGNHTEPYVIIDTRFTRFDDILQQLATSYASRHDHLHVAFNLEYHVQVANNGPIIEDDKSWNELIQSTTDEETIPLTVMVHLREKANSSLESINHEWDELCLSHASASSNLHRNANNNNNNYNNNNNNNNNNYAYTTATSMGGGIQQNHHETSSLDDDGLYPIPSQALLKNEMDKELKSDWFDLIVDRVLDKDAQLFQEQQ